MSNTQKYSIFKNVKPRKAAKSRIWHYLHGEETETWVRHCTCDRVELGLLQDESEHEDELRGTLGKRLYEPQQAEIVAHVHGVSLWVLCEEGAQRHLHDTCMPEKEQVEHRVKTIVMTLYDVFY